MGNDYCHFSFVFFLELLLVECWIFWKIPNFLSFFLFFSFLFSKIFFHSICKSTIRMKIGFWLSYFNFTKLFLFFCTFMSHLPGCHETNSLLPLLWTGLDSLLHVLTGDNQFNKCQFWNYLFPCMTPQLDCETLKGRDVTNHFYIPSAWHVVLMCHKWRNELKFGKFILIILPWKMKKSSIVCSLMIVYQVDKYDQELL